MSLKIFGVWSVATLVFLGVATAPDGSIVPLIAWLLVTIPGYITSLHLHPRRACWSCEGTGKHTGLVFDYANRACENCGGSGRRRRLGARILNIPEN